jgi:hypothetical protein
MIISSVMLRGVGEGRNQNVQYGQAKSTYEARPVICVHSDKPAYLRQGGGGEENIHIYTLPRASLCISMSRNEHANM